ncbi:MAG: GAF domain-containing protein [Anaerolineae bacterium]|nr:GAF domain-containing protein [Anaerolineae bacterium]
MIDLPEGVMFSERQRLDALYAIVKTMRNQDANPRTVLQTALTMTGQAIGVQHGCVVTFRKDDRVDDILAMKSAEPEAERKLWLRLISRGLIGFVHHSRRLIVVRDISTDPRWPRLEENDAVPQSGSAIGLPMEKNGYMYGVLVLIHPQVDHFSEEIIEWLASVVDTISAVIGSAVVLNATPKDEGHYRWLFEDAVMPIIITDLDGYIVDANRRACEMLRYKRQDLLKLPISAIHRMGTGPIGANRFESLQMGHEVEFRSTAWPSEGGDIPVTVRARRVFFDDYDVIAWVEQDISAQMELDQLRQDLTAMVYHDLRGPLHTVYSSLSTLGRLLTNSTQPAVQDLLQVGIRSTRQLSRMIESLLDIQRLEEGKAVLDPKPTSVHSLLANAAQLVQPLASESRQKLIFNMLEELPFITCDADMILRVVTNLMENAVKYSPMGGTIKLGAERSSEGIRIVVSDSGPGIPKHMQRQIFDKFSRVKYKDAPKGLGLGLAFCRLAVEAHGGTIWVESEPGEGSAFIFTLPVDEKAEPVRV